jgi:hypothetical protein
MAYHTLKTVLLQQLTAAYPTILQIGCTRLTFLGGCQVLPERFVFMLDQSTAAGILQGPVAHLSSAAEGEGNLLPAKHLFSYRKVLRLGQSKCEAGLAPLGIPNVVHQITLDVVASQPPSYLLRLATHQVLAREVGEVMIEIHKAVIGVFVASVLVSMAVIGVFVG